MIQKIEHRKLEVELTESDIVERGKEQAKLTVEVLALELERAKVNARIKPKKERVEELAITVDRGTEMRNIECEWKYDWRRGVRSLYRTDNFECVEADDIIPEHEKQMHFESHEGQDDRFTQTDELAQEKAA